MFDGINLVTHAKNQVYHLATWPPGHSQKGQDSLVVLHHI